MNRGFVVLLGLKGKVHVEIERLSHEELRLEITSSKYNLNEKAVIKNEELRKTLLELMQAYKLSPETVCTSDITISTYLLL
jgi:hypothetical protein